MTLYLIFSVVFACISHTNQQFTCRTAVGGSGQCVSLPQCPSLLALVNKPYSTPQDYQILKQSQCGFANRTPKVCCPRQTITTVRPRPLPQTRPTIRPWPMPTIRPNPTPTIRPNPTPTIRPNPTPTIRPNPTQTQPNVTPAPANRCFTPDGQMGQCINLYSCPQLVNLLQEPVSNKAVQFVKNSRCEGPEEYSVCCGKSSVSLEPVSKPKKCNLNAAPPDPRSECCGIDIGNSRIVGGTTAAIDEYPWLVMIEYLDGNQIKLLCGGALISGRYVLTAAHCVHGRVLELGRPVNVRLGEYNITNAGPDCVTVAGGGVDCTPGPIIVPIEKTIVHTGYGSTSNRRNDIALIKLRNTAPYTDFIRPICLPTTDLTQTRASNLRLFVAGWGAVNEFQSSSDVKMHVDLPYKPLNVCQQSYNNNGLQLWKGQICAGGEMGKDSCKGDSGGPLMYENYGHFEVVGVVSFGPTPCGQLNIPGIYTNVYEYLPWIRSQIQP